LSRMGEGSAICVYVYMYYTIEEQLVKETISIPLAELVILHLQSNFISVTEGTPTVAVCVVADNPAAIGGSTILVTISATPGSALG